MIPYGPARVAQGIAMRQSGPPLTLLRASLLQPSALSFDTLHLLLRVKGLALARSRSRKDVLEALAATEGDADFVKHVIDHDGRSKTSHTRAGLEPSGICGRPSNAAVAPRPRVAM